MRTQRRDASIPSSRVQRPLVLKEKLRQRGVVVNAQPVGAAAALGPAHLDPSYLLIVRIILQDVLQAPAVPAHCGLQLAGEPFGCLVVAAAHQLPLQIQDFLPVR